MREKTSKNYFVYQIFNPVNFKVLIINELINSTFKKRKNQPDKVRSNLFVLKRTKFIYILSNISDIYNLFMPL